MSKTKRLLSFALAATMLFSTVLVGVNAEDATPKTGTLNIGTATVEVGEPTATVDFTLTFDEAVKSPHSLCTIISDYELTNLAVKSVDGTVVADDENLAEGDDDLVSSATVKISNNGLNLAAKKVIFESGVDSNAPVVTTIVFTATFDTSAAVAGTSVVSAEIDATNYDENTFALTVNAGEIVVAEPHEHNFVGEETTPATCTTPGVMTYTCECGEDSYTEEIPVIPHNYVDGACDVCGAADPDYVPEIEKFEIVASNVTLGNALNMNFAFNKSDIVGTDNYAVITKTFADGRESIVKTVPQSEWGTSGNYYTAPSNGIPAKEMGDDIYVTLYNSKDQAISETRVDSVLSYVSRNIEKYITADKSTTSGLKNYKTGVMLADMIVYGAASQTQIGYDTTNLVTDRLTAILEETKTKIENGSDWLNYTTQTVEYSNNVVKGSHYVASNLSLKESIELNIALKNLDNVAAARVSYTKWNGTAYSNTINKEDFSYISPYNAVKINTLVVGDCFADVTIELLDANGNVIDTSVDSVASYCARQPGDLYPAVMKFVNSSYAYLTRNQ